MPQGNRAFRFKNNISKEELKEISFLVLLGFEVYDSFRSVVSTKHALEFDIKEPHSNPVSFIIGKLSDLKLRLNKQAKRLRNYEASCRK